MMLAVFRRNVYRINICYDNVIAVRAIEYDSVIYDEQVRITMSNANNYPRTMRSLQHDFHRQIYIQII